MNSGLTNTINQSTLSWKSILLLGPELVVEEFFCIGLRQGRWLFKHKQGRTKHDKYKYKTREYEPEASACQLCRTTRLLMMSLLSPDDTLRHLQLSDTASN
jgi:hypothetical protein